MISSHEVAGFIYQSFLFFSNINVIPFGSYTPMEMFLAEMEVFNIYGLQNVRYMHIILPDTNVREVAES